MPIPNIDWYKAYRDYIAMLSESKQPPPPRMKVIIEKLMQKHPGLDKNSFWRGYGILYNPTVMNEYDSNDYFTDPYREGGPLYTVDQVRQGMFILPGESRDFAEFQIELTNLYLTQPSIYSRLSFPEITDIEKDTILRKVGKNYVERERLKRSRDESLGIRSITRPLAPSAEDTPEQILRSIDTYYKPLTQEEEDAEDAEYYKQQAQAKRPKRFFGLFGGRTRRLKKRAKTFKRKRGGKRRRSKKTRR